MCELHVKPKQTCESKWWRRQYTDTRAITNGGEGRVDKSNKTNNCNGTSTGRVEKRAAVHGGNGIANKRSKCSGGEGQIDKRSKSSGGKGRTNYQTETHQKS